MGATHRALIKACLKQDVQAQKRLYELFSTQMLTVCARYAGSRHEAEDILQEGFIKVFQNLPRYKDTGPLEGWIRRIMVNTAIDYLRRNKRRQQELELNETILNPHWEDALDQMEANFLLELIQQLPDGYRMVFNLYALEGYSHQEIAQQLGISEGTSRSQYTRARQHLQRLIQAAYREKKIYRDAI